MTVEEIKKMLIPMDRSILEPMELQVYQFLKNKKNIDADSIFDKIKKVPQLCYAPIKDTIGALAAFFYHDNEKMFIIDESYVEFDTNGNPIGMKLGKLERIILVHEILHAASCYESEIFQRIVKEKYGMLDEGITQMLAEKIFGYTISPATDGYSDYKKIAKILDLTFGEDVILDFYFNHKNNLHQECNNLAIDPDYFSKLNSHMNALKNVLRPRENNQSSLKSCRASLYQYVCINTIIPKLKSLKTSAEKTEYIAGILEVLRDDPETSYMIQSALKTLGSLSDTRLEEENRKIDEELYIKEVESSIISQIDKGAECGSSCIVTEDGRIFLKDDSSIEIVDEHLKEIILGKIFFEERKFSDEQKEDFFTQVREMCKNIQTGNKLKIGSESQSSLDRKKELAAMKSVATENGYVILNSLAECDEGNYVDLSVVSSPKKGVLPCFQDLKMIFENYEVNFEDVTGRGSQIVVRDRRTKEIVTNPDITSYAKFANLWVKSADQRAFEGNDPQKTRAFKSPNDEIFKKISELITQSLESSGTIIPEKIYEEISSIKYKYAETIAYELFENNENLQIIYNFYSKYCYIADSEIELPATTAEVMGMLSPTEDEYEEAVITVAAIAKRCEEDELRRSETVQSCITTRDATGSKIINPILEVRDW